jgi:hypothetical protein
LFVFADTEDVELSATESDGDNDTISMSISSEVKYVGQRVTRCAARVYG